MFTYLLVFVYTANGNSYFTTKVKTFYRPFCVDDIESLEAEASKNNKHLSRLINIVSIEASRK